MFELHSKFSPCGDQPQAIAKLVEGVKDGLRTQVLLGVTGSGKTQVYIRLIRETLGRGRTALVLVPEIVLTPQLLRIFAAHFGAQVAVLHSSLRAGERYDEWKRARRGEAQVVIGTRSAVFAPLDNLGLIILDEEQEGSYKSENAPRYHARDVAKIPLREKQSPAGAGLGHAVGGDHVPGSNGPDRAVPVKQQVQPKGAAPGADCGPERGAAPGQRGGRQLRFAP